MNLRRFIVDSADVRAQLRADRARRRCDALTDRATRPVLTKATIAELDAQVEADRTWRQFLRAVRYGAAGRERELND